jgi:O-antigen/teichoic acid export membrane protein
MDDTAESAPHRITEATVNESGSKSFISNAIMYGIGSLLLEAASIVLLPLYLNYLRPEDFGTLEILNRIGSIVVIGLMANGFRMATLTFYQQATSLADRRHVASTVSVALFLVVLAGALFTCAAAPWLVEWLGLASEELLIFGMTTVLLESLVIIPLALMQARIESGRYVATTFSIFLARVILTIYLVSFLGLGLWGILIGRAAIAIFFGALLNGLELRTSSRFVNWTTFRDVGRFAIPFLPGGLLAFFVNNGDRFYLLRQAGEHEVGIYSLSYRIAGAIGMITFIPLYKVWSAKMYAAASLKNAPQIFGVMFTRIMTTLVGAGLAASLFAEDILHMLGGEAYIAAIQYLPPLAVATILMSAADLMDSGFYITRKTQYKPAIFLVTGIVIFFAYAILIPRFGRFGAAWAPMIAFLIHAFLTWRFTQKVFRVEYEWPRLIAVLGFASICWLVSNSFTPPQYRLQFNVAIFSSWIALVCCIATGEERRAVLNGVRRAIGKAPAQAMIGPQELPCPIKQV